MLGPNFCVNAFVRSSFKCVCCLHGKDFLFFASTGMRVTRVCTCTRRGQNCIAVILMPHLSSAKGMPKGRKQSLCRSACYPCRYGLTERDANGLLGFLPTLRVRQFVACGVIGGAFFPYGLYAQKIRRRKFKS